jgi:hypothetical protein
LFPQVKLKSGVELSRFDKTGVQFTDGTRLDVDAVIFATGFRVDVREDVANILTEKGEKGSSSILSFKTFFFVFC